MREENLVRSVVCNGIVVLNVEHTIRQDFVTMSTVGFFPYIKG